jgi:riboflavin synthase
MFTGIIEAVGKVQVIQPMDGGKRITFAIPGEIREMGIGDSICVNGVCLTVVAQAADSLTVEAVGETLEKTNIGDLKTGMEVNLERALAAGGRFGGHIVQGHVNAVATITDWHRRGENWFLAVDLPEALMRYVILEGSIAIDGISLTVASLAGKRVGINIIPHTARVTNLRNREVGQSVNIEVDVLAKYVENLLTYQRRPNMEPKP